MLNKPEYPCAHPSLPPNSANYRICLVPQPGLRQGRQGVTGPLFVDKWLAALTAEEHRAGEVVARGEVLGGPSKRTRPFSMNTTRSEIAAAMFSDCSTITIV